MESTACHMIAAKINQLLKNRTADAVVETVISMDDINAGDVKCGASLVNS